MDCLRNIIGVTKEDCECVIGGMTSEEIAALRLSTSGLYMDDLPGGVHLKALKNIDSCKWLSKMALGARDNAIKALTDDLTVALNERYKKSRTNYIGQIGRMSYAQTLGISKPVQGLRLAPIDRSDAVITLNRLNIILNESVAVTIKVYRVLEGAVMGEEIASYDVVAAANGYSQVIPETPLKMPVMYNSESVEYYFLYDLTGTTAKPKDTTLKCSTCPTANTYENYLHAQGVQLSDMNNLQGKITDAYSHGLILDVEIKCDQEKFICREYREDDAVSVTMANAVWFKSGELLIEDVLKQPDVNRYTTMAREYLWGKRNHFKAEYQSRVIYLAAVIDVSASNCYVCRETINKPFFAPILS